MRRCTPPAMTVLKSAETTPLLWLRFFFVVDVRRAVCHSAKLPLVSASRPAMRTHVMNGATLCPR